jgi:hypothetical protein
MDSTTAVANFSLTTSGAAPPANHLQASGGGVLPPQQQPSLAEQVNDSFSQVFVVPLHIMGTQTLAIVALSNTHQVVSLKLTYEHKLSLLANADEALSPWSRCFSLR